MLFQDLLREIDLTRCKLIRHNTTNEVVRRNNALGNIEYYQRIQSAARFKECDYVCSFLGEQGTEGKFIGVYRVSGYVSLEQADLPSDFQFDNDAFSDCVYWTLEKTDILSDLAGMLVIEWGKGTINWCQKGTTEKKCCTYCQPSPK